MTERLGTLKNLHFLSLQTCALAYLPNLSGIPALSDVDLSDNRLSKVDGLTGVNTLVLNKNLFTDLPKLNTPNTLLYLSMNNNPVKNMLAINSHVNLQTLSLQSASLTSIPATIDKLQQLKKLDLSGNQLFFVPTNILSLSKLEYLDIRSNLFTSTDIETIRARFTISHAYINFLT